MTNRYLYITLLAILGPSPLLATLGSAANYGLEADGVAQSQTADRAPRLVVSIAVDQLRSDFLEAFAPLYGDNGFKRLLQGTIYTSASYPFTPVDRASAVAALASGVTPYYNSIVGQRWLNRETLRPVWCTDDAKNPGVQTAQSASPVNLSTSTTGDELKVATGGQALVWSVAPYCDAAVMAGGHAANGALWIDDAQGLWCTSQYYLSTLPQWVNNVNRKDAPAKKAGGKDVQRYRRYKSSATVNGDVTTMACECMANNAMGTDNVTDLLCITYFAGGNGEQHHSDNARKELQDTYVKLDSELARLMAAAERQTGKGNTLFVLTSTGYSEEKEEADYQKYRIPTGTFYMNRTADLLNMYMGAIWGQGRYVEKTFRNHIFLNHSLLDKKTISIADATGRAQELLVMMAGVRNVYTSLQLLTLGNEQIGRVRSGYNPERCGDLVVETAPGWRVLTESTNESEYTRAAFMQFPIIFFGTGIKAQRIQTPVTTDRIAPTIAKAIRIRAPNACSSEPLF